MDETTRNEDGWVMARLVALEQMNRRLWIAIAALGMTGISVCLAAYFVMANLELPAGAVASDADPGASLVANDLTLHGALRVVDEAGRNLVWIGREPATSGASAAPGQAVVGLFAASGPEATQQTVRIATSPLGSALALSTPDGHESVSAFAGDTGVALELRRGETTRVLSERADGTAAARAPAAKEPAARPDGKRSEAPAIAATAKGEAERGTQVDLSDAVIQPLGGGFYVGQLALSDQGGVLRVSGRLINASSIDQLRAEFRLTVAGRELPFSVGRIPAGSSTAFTVELPSANSAALRAARLRWVRSTLSFLSE
ncbi:MAG: hypothetical protein WEF50_22670 [Myxococcota bacterium]